MKLKNIWRDDVTSKLAGGSSFTGYLIHEEVMSFKLYGNIKRVQIPTCPIAKISLDGKQ